jgi:hypothetical protein
VLLNDQEFRDKLTNMGQDPDKPTKLPVMLLGELLATNIVTSCDLYGSGGKLKCRFDGKNCVRLNPKTLEYEPAECKQMECADFNKGDCAWYHRLRVMLPDAAGIGYWQIATKSDNNRGALYREMNDLRKIMRGRLAGYDLMLILTNERQFHIPVNDTQNGGKKLIPTNPYLMHLEAGTSLRKLMNSAPTGDVYDAEVIEESFDNEGEPIVQGGPGERPYDNGDPAAIGPEAEATAKREAIINLAGVCFESPKIFGGWLKEQFGKKMMLANLTFDELIQVHDRLVEMVGDIEPDEGEQATDAEFEVGEECDV